MLRTVGGGTVLTHDLPLKLHRDLRLNEVFCEVAPLDSMRIVIPLTEKQVRWVHKGQPVELKSYAYPGITISGQIAEDPVTMVGGGYARGLLHAPPRGCADGPGPAGEGNPAGADLRGRNPGG